VVDSKYWAEQKRNEWLIVNTGQNKKGMSG